METCSPRELVERRIDAASTALSPTVDIEVSETSHHLRVTAWSRLANVIRSTTGNFIFRRRISNGPPGARFCVDTTPLPLLP